MDFLDLIDSKLKGASIYNVNRKGELIFSKLIIKSQFTILNMTSKKMIC